MKSVIVTPPVGEPITTTDLSEHARIDTHEQDAYYETRITAARQATEAFTHTVLLTQTWDDSFDLFCDLVLAKQPVQSITSVTYIDTAGDTQTVANTIYELGEVFGLGVVRLKFQQVWPSDVRSHPDSITVRYIAGYGLAVDVPQEIKAAMELYASHFNENREGENPLSRSFQNMLGPFCFKTFPNP